MAGSETEDFKSMNNAERGAKHSCPDCATKFYDLHRKVVACPKCGAKLQEAKPVKATQKRQRGWSMPARRYP